MEQIQHIKGELESALNKKDSTKAIESLQSLSNIPVTMVVLHDTHIGATVNKVRRQFEDQEVVSLSRSVMRKWKKMFEQYRENRSDSSNPSTTQIEGDSSDLESKSADGTSSRPKVSAPVPQTTSVVRLKFREMIVQALRTSLPKELDNQEPFLDEEELAAHIEEQIFLEFKSESDMKYKNRLRSRILNLKDNKNPYLRLNVLRGDITPERIAKMTAEEMASDELKRQREIYTKEAINDHQMALTTGTRTSEIKCPACKKSDCTYNQMQTRSSDEPMTTFCFCNNCGKRWKFC